MNQITDVMQKEAPISSTVLTKRIINAWGMTRAGNRINSYMEDLCQHMRFPQSKTLQTVFYWNAAQVPKEYSLYRPPANEETRRNMDCICKEETAQAVKFVLENQISLTREDLKKEVYKLFGFSRMGQSMDIYINEGIDYSIVIDIAFEDNGRIILK